MGRDTPLITVLMATYNGMPFLPDQVTSILDQGGVRVELFVSDDQSADGTWEWLQGKARDDTRIRLLPRVHSSGVMPQTSTALCAASISRDVTSSHSPTRTTSGHRESSHIRQR